MATIFNPFFTAVDGNGNVRANAKLYFYQTGTSTPQDTYSDAALTAVNTNPVVADSDGLFPAIYLGDPPDYVAYKAILKTSGDVTVATRDPIAGAPLTTPISASILRGYLSGLQRTGSTGTTYDQDAGVATDDTNTVVMSLVSGTINAATVGANGLDAGALTATATFHAFAIGKTDGTTARLMSASPTSPTMPSGYVYKRRTASLKTTVSSQIITHLQNGDYFSLTAPVVEFTVSAAGATAVTRTLTGVPTGIIVEPVMTLVLSVTSGGATELVYVSSLSQTDEAASISNAQLQCDTAGGTISNSESGQVVGIFTNTSSQIRTRQAQAGSAQTFGIRTHGWIDRRGRDD